MTKCTNTTTTTDPAKRVARLAALRKEIAELLNTVGDRWQALEVESAEHCEALEREIRRDRTGNVAKTVATGCAEGKIDTGSLCSRLVDAVERRGHQLYPPQYDPIRPRWSIVSRG